MLSDSAISDGSGSDSVMFHSTVQSGNSASRMGSSHLPLQADSSLLGGDLASFTAELSDSDGLGATSSPNDALPPSPELGRSDRNASRSPEQSSSLLSASAERLSDHPGRELSRSYLDSERDERTSLSPRSAALPSPPQHTIGGGTQSQQSNGNSFSEASRAPQDDLRSSDRSAPGDGDDDGFFNNRSAWEREQVICTARLFLGLLCVVVDLTAWLRWSRSSARRRRGGARRTEHALPPLATTSTRRWPACRWAPPPPLRRLCAAMQCGPAVRLDFAPLIKLAASTAADSIGGVSSSARSVKVACAPSTLTMRGAERGAGWRPDDRWQNQECSSGGRPVSTSAVQYSHCVWHGLAFLLQSRSLDFWPFMQWRAHSNKPNYC